MREMNMESELREWAKAHSIDPNKDESYLRELKRADDDFHYLKKVREKGNDLTTTHGK